MEELQILVNMVAELPTMALWVLLGFWAYKIIVVGSIYGVIKFCSQKIHDVFVAYSVKSQNIRLLLDGEIISGTKEALMAQLQRIKSTAYIHGSDIDWLRDAITEKKEREKDAKPQPRNVLSL